MVNNTTQAPCADRVTWRKGQYRIVEQVDSSGNRGKRFEVLYALNDTTPSTWVNIMDLPDVESKYLLEEMFQIRESKDTTPVNPKRQQCCSSCQSCHMNC